MANKENKKEDREPAKRGRGTSKTAIIGAVERGGQVVAEVAKGLTGRAILEFIRRVVNVKESELLTDEYHAYNALSGQLKHEVINHQEQYDGDKHTYHRGLLVITQTSVVWTTSPLQHWLHTAIYRNDVTSTITVILKLFFGSLSTVV